MSLDIGSFIEQSQDKLDQVQPQAVGANLLLWSSISLGTVLAFNILRPRNKVVYEPKVKYHVGNKKPPKISDGFFSWVSPLLHTKEPELLDKLGLDAVTFLRFLRLMRWLFLVIAFIVSAILIPVNVTYSVKHVVPQKRDALSILTIRDVRGSNLYVHVGAVYLVTFAILGFVWIHWKEMVRLRHEWFASDEYQKSFYARTLMVIDVPKKMQSDEGLVSLFQQLHMPYPTTSVHIGRRVGKLPELVEYHNDAVRELETYLVRYLKGGKIGNKRPTITKGGCLGIGGTKKDAIDFYTTKLKKTESAVEKWRSEIDLRQAEPYGFASLASVPYAHIVAHLLQGKHPKGTTIMLAPNPKDIIWENLNSTAGERRSKQIVGFIWLSVVAFFNTIPLIIISALANLTAVASSVAFLFAWSQASPKTFSLASAILPPVVSSLFGYLLPIIMRWLSKYQGAATRTRLDRAVVARYFAFLVISQLFIFSLIGVGFNCWGIISAELGKHAPIGEIFKSLKSLPNQIHTTYIKQSNYWLAFFPLRGFLVVFDLAQVINLVITSIKTHLFGRTPRDIREWTKPPDFDYAIYYSNLLFMAAVGLVFAPLAPLVGVACCVVFWLSSVVYKYQLMFVFVSKVESGGRLWNVAINRLLAATVLMQLLMTLTIGLRQGFKTWTWISTIPPILMVFIFKFVVDKTFDKKFRYYTPDEADISKSQIYSASSDSQGHRLEKRFGHPALYADLFTPMVHAKMVHLLPQVYSGNLGHDSATLDEYDGQKLEAQVLPGGIKIAAVEQTDLEYDPALYGRDRGEADWDRRSSHHLLSDAASFAHSKVGVPAARMQAYMSNGISQHAPWGQQRRPSQHDIELTRLDSRTDLLHLEQLAPPGRPYTPSQYSMNTHYTDEGVPRAVTPSQRPPMQHAESSYDYPPERHQQRPLLHPSNSSFDLGQQYPPMHQSNPSYDYRQPQPQRLDIPHGQYHQQPSPQGSQRSYTPQAQPSPYHSPQAAPQHRPYASEGPPQQGHYDSRAGYQGYHGGYGSSG